MALQGVYGVLQAEGRMRGIAGVQTLERVTGLIALLAVGAVATLSVKSSEVVLALAALVTCVIAFTVLTPPGLFRAGEDRHEDHLVRTVMEAVGGMGIVSVCAYGIAWAEIYVLDAFRPRGDVGIYSLAYQVLRSCSSSAPFGQSRRCRDTCARAPPGRTSARRSRSAERLRSPGSGLGRWRSEQSSPAPFCPQSSVRTSRTLLRR